MSIRERKMFYHLTDLNNIDSIIEYGLLPRKTIIDNKIKFNDVADNEIINFRKLHGLDEFIPFHFYPFTPFDWDVQTTHKSKIFIYICITKEIAKHNNLKIIPMHPLSMNPFILYDYKDGLDEINWILMETKNYKNGECKKICLAECLCDKRIPLECFQSIAVKDEETKMYIQEKVNKPNIKIHIDVRKNWFI